MKNTFLLSMAMAFFPFLSVGVEPKGNPDGEIADLSLKRLSAIRTEIKDRKLPVSDWKVRLKNASSQPRWVPTIAQGTSSKYLIERNPKQISYRVFEKMGAEWTDTNMGWTTLVGPKDNWLKVEPGEEIEFVIPIFDRFKTEPASVRLEIRVALDSARKNIETLVTKPFTHAAEQD